MTIFRHKLASDHTGTNTLVVTNRIFMGKRGTLGSNRGIGRRSRVRIHNRGVPFIDHKNCGLSGTIGTFSLSLRSGVYVSVNTSANKFASYVLRGKTAGIFSISIKCNRLT